MGEPVTWSEKRALCVALSVLAGCSREPDVALPPVSSSPSPVGVGDGAVATAECDQAIDGTPCGTPGAGTHCIANTCARNACGDGVRAQEEECDDGDDRNDDGCDSRCTIQIPGCTNGRVESGEECDDGNRDNGDACTNRCTKARCGDAIKGPNEACDDGNSRDDDGCTQRCRPSTDAGVTDAGAAGTDAGDVDASKPIDAAAGSDAALEAAVPDASNPADTGTGTPDTGPGPSGPYDAGAECMACRRANCSDYLGADMVRGCMEQINSEYVSSASDPLFLQQCIDILACAQANDCAYKESGPLGCYCGSKGLDGCASDGPATDSPCRNQWLAGSRTTSNTEVLANISDLQFPSAWAFYLLDCERQPCQHLCQ